MKRKLPPQRAYIAFGSNLGARRRMIERALAELALVDGITLRRVSPLYETDAVGGPRQGRFLNGVAEVRSSVTAVALMASLLAVERRLGRRRVRRWGPRSIDLDLLTFGQSRRRARGLTLPHPRYHERRFVLAPFADLAPRLRHPVLGVTNRALLRRLPAAGQRVTMVGTWTKSRYRLFAKRKKPASGL